MKASLLSLTVVALIAAGSPAFAADESWTGGAVTDGNWSDIANWNGGAAPGSTASTTSTDVSTFNAAIANTWGASSGNPVVIDSATQNIGGINFDLAAGSYFIGGTGGNSLFLTGGGITQILNTLTSTNVTETLNAPLMLEGDYTLSNNSANGTGAGTGTLMAGGGIAAAAGTDTLTLSGSNTNANLISGAIGNGSGTVSVLKSGAGLWQLTGTNTYSGTTTINGGTLEINNSAALGNASATNTITMGGGTLEFTANNVTLAANQAITLTANSVLETDGAYTKLVTINGAIDDGGHTLFIESLNGSGNTSTMTINGIISGSGGLTKTLGPGGPATGANGLTLKLTGANTYSGVTTISAPNPNFGAVAITAANNLGDGSVTNTINLGGTLQTTGTFDLGVNRSIAITGAAEINSTSGTLTVSGNITNSGNGWSVIGAGNVIISGSLLGNVAGGRLAYGGTGTLFLTGNNSTWNKTASNTFGLLEINNGTVNANTASLNGTGTGLTGDIIFGQAGTTGGILQAGTGGITLQRNVDLEKAGVFDTNGTTSTISGVVANGFNFAGTFAVKDSATGGSLALTGTNTYTSGTTINSGTLYANSTTGSATGTGAVTVNSGGKLGGTGKIAPGAGNGITLNNGATLISGGVQAAVSPTTLAGAGLALNNTTAASTILKANSGSTFVFSLGFTPGGDTGFSLTNPNTSSTFLTITGNTANELNFAASGVTFTINDLTGGGNNLLYQKPFLLVSAGANTDYTGLVITAPDMNGNGLVTNITLNGTAFTEYAGLSLYLENGNLEVLAAPEPSTFALALGGAALVLALRRLRRTAS